MNKYIGTKLIEAEPQQKLYKGEYIGEEYM